MDIQYLVTETLEPYSRVNIPISEEDYNRLKADITQNGIKTPLHVKGHIVLAGANRLRIAKELGIRFVPCLVIEKDLTELEMREYVIADNLSRRHLTVEQKAALALEIEKIEQAKAKKRQNSGLKQNQIETNRNLSVSSESEHTAHTADEGSEEKGRALKLAAQKAGISFDTAFKAKTLAEKAPDQWQDVQAGKKTINRAYTDFRQQNMNIKTPQAQGMVDVQDLKKHMDRVYLCRLDLIQLTAKRILDNYRYLSDEDKERLTEIFNENFDQIISTMEILIELQKIVLA
jgi:ParB-like chromosome segregation protein Spo0J